MFMFKDSPFNSVVLSDTQSNPLWKMRRCLAKGETDLRMRIVSNLDDDGIYKITASDEEADQKNASIFTSDGEENLLINNLNQEESGSELSDQSHDIESSDGSLRMKFNKIHRTSLDLQQEEYLRNKMRLQLYWQNDELIRIMENEIK